MSLKHSFSIIENKEKMEKVDVSDEFINYIKDSILWIDSLWNEKTYNKGLPYYGRSIISKDEILKLKSILNAWRKLFALAPEKVSLTGGFLIEEMKYEKIIYKKNELLETIDQLIQLCNKAEELKTDILYEGI